MRGSLTMRLCRGIAQPGVHDRTGGRSRRADQRGHRALPRGCPPPGGHLCRAGNSPARRRGPRPGAGRGEDSDRVLPGGKSSRRHPGQFSPCGCRKYHHLTRPANIHGSTAEPGTSPDVDVGWPHFSTRTRRPHRPREEPADRSYAPFIMSLNLLVAPTSSGRSASRRARARSTYTSTSSVARSSIVSAR